jgi:Undecaprenyl-phosphate galactose phosphotransferase WbaP
MTHSDPATIRQELPSAVPRDRQRTASATTAILPWPKVPWPGLWSPHWPRGARIGILLLSDLLALVTAASLSYLLWARSVLHQPPELYTALLPLLCLFPLGYAGMGLYPGFGVGAVETLRRLSYCTSFAFLVLAGASFALKLPSHYSRMTFVIAWGMSLVLVPLWRFLTLSIARRWDWWGEPTVLIGHGSWVRWAIRALENALSLGYRPVGVLSPDHHASEAFVEDIPIFGDTALAPYLAKRGVRVALVEVGERGINGATLSHFQQYFRHVVVIREVQDLPVERVRVCNLGGILGIEFTNDLLHWRNRCIKRLMDLALGTLFFAMAWPLIVFGGGLIKLLSRGPFLYCQIREGMGGHPIKVWKLRTMYQDAEQRLESFLATDPVLRREWEQRFKLAHDPRIIPVVGTILRRLSIDELPQLWSVIKGEMSLIGPRPFPEYHLRQFSTEFRELRCQVRPGLTGLWQVMVRSDGGIDVQQAYDTYYIRNWSTWMDLWILFRTIRAVLLSKGAC